MALLVETMAIELSIIAIKDRYTLIEHSGTLVEQSYCTLHKGFNFITLCYFEACTSNTSVSSEN